MAGFFDELDAALRMRSWAELTGWCKRMVSRYLGAGARRERWPEEEREAADRALDAVVGAALGAPQRIFVRDFLYSLGWERP